MTKPFGRQGAEEFIKACRDGDYDQVSALLSRNKYLLFDFDWTNLTGLHWAVIRGHDLIVEYLIRRKADVNARDVVRLMLNFLYNYWCRLEKHRLFLRQEAGILN